MSERLPPRTGLGALQLPQGGGGLPSEVAFRLHTERECEGKLTSQLRRGCRLPPPLRRARRRTPHQAADRAPPRASPSVEHHAERVPLFNVSDYSTFTEHEEEASGEIDNDMPRQPMAIQLHLAHGWSQY